MKRKDGPVSIDRTKFSRITVTSDEDDVVIHAGARPEPATAPENDDAFAEHAPEGGMPGGEAGTDGDELEEEAPLDAPGDPARTERETVPGAPDRVPSAERAARAATSAKPDAAYRETTAEDLESAPMSLMQKIIIALAALAVVAIVAYIVLVR